MPQKQPPANTTVCVFGGAECGRSTVRATAVVAETAASKPAPMSPRVKPRIMVPSSVPLSRSTLFCPFSRTAVGLGILRASGRGHLGRIARSKHFHHFVGNVSGAHDPESNDQ